MNQKGQYQLITLIILLFVIFIAIGWLLGYRFSLDKFFNNGFFK